MRPHNVLLHREDAVVHHDVPARQDRGSTGLSIRALGNMPPGGEGACSP